jgi:hypothetical protein
MKFYCGTNKAPATLTVTTNAVTPDASLGNNFNATNGANLTVNNMTNLTADDDGREFRVRVKNSGASAITVSLGTSYRFGSQLTALSSVAAGKTNYIGLVYNAADSKLDVVSEQVGF